MYLILPFSHKDVLISFAQSPEAVQRALLNTELQFSLDREFIFIKDTHTKKPNQNLSILKYKHIHIVCVPPKESAGFMVFEAQAFS